MKTASHYCDLFEVYQISSLEQMLTSIAGMNVSEMCSAKKVV